MGEALRRRIKQQRFENPLQEALLNVLVAGSHIREHLDRLCAPYGITHSQYNVLRILRGAHPHGHPRCEIAVRMVERAPDVTRLIDRLEKQGLVSRDRTAKDRRLSIARITRKGLDLLEQMKIDDWFVERYTGRISSRDKKELSRICEKIYGEDV